MFAFSDFCHAVMVDRQADYSVDKIQLQLPRISLENTFKGPDLVH